jgi:hypothetical protein
MQDLVSTRWIRVAGVAASLPVAWAIFSFAGLAWGLAFMVLAGMALTASGAHWLGSRSNRSVQQMIADLEGEPIPAVARAPVPPPARRTNP